MTTDRLAGPLASLHAAFEYREFIRAAFRLLEAATPGCLASAMLRHVHAEGALWMCSDERLDPEAIERLYRDHPGQHLLVKRPGAKVLPSEGLLSWRHTVGLYFWDAPSMDGLDFILSIHRTEAQGDFTPCEIELLGSLHLQIDRARQRINRLHTERSTLSTLEDLIRGLPLAAAVLDWELRPTFYNAAALDAVTRWQTGENTRKTKLGRSGFHTPADLLGICEQMKTEWNAARFRDSRAGQTIERKRIHPQCADWNAAISLKPLNHHSAIGKPSFLLRFTMPTTGCNACVSAPKNLPVLARLTPEERTIAEHICHGRSNDEIASLLSKSIWTVKRQVYSIFRKLPVSSRTRLAALLLGQTVEP